MNSEKAIEKIHEFERFGSILGLERMTRLLELLGNPQDDLKVIHVAGTNGKGSVCRYIYSMLEAGGYKTGIYISPFIEIFNERIELDGEYISDEDLAVYTDKVLKAAEMMTNAGKQSPGWSWRNRRFNQCVQISFDYRNNFNIYGSYG